MTVKYCDIEHFLKSNLTKAPLNKMNTDKTIQL